MDTWDLPGLDEIARKGVAHHDLNEPWEARAVAIAVALVERSDLTWDDFRLRLVEEVERDADRSYYDSWVAALESLVRDAALVSEQVLVAHRREAATYRTAVEGQHVDVVALDAGPRTIEALVADLEKAGVDATVDATACRHLELHRSQDGACAVRAYGDGGVALLGVAIDRELWDEFTFRYPGASTSPAPTMASRSTNAANASTSSPSVPDGRSGSTK